MERNNEEIIMNHHRKLQNELNQKINGLNEKLESVESEINKEITKDLKIQKHRKDIEFRMGKICVIENRFNNYQHQKINKLSFVNSMNESQILYIEQLKEVEIDLNHNGETIKSLKEIQDNENKKLSEQTWKKIKGEQFNKFKKEHMMKCKQLKQKTIDFANKTKEYQVKRDEIKKKLKTLNKNNYDQNNQNKDINEKITKIKGKINISNQTIGQYQKIQNDLKEWKQKISAEKRREQQLNQHNDKHEEDEEDEEDEDDDLNQNNQRYQEPIDLTSDGENNEITSNSNKRQPFYGFDQNMYDEIEKERYLSLNSRKRSYPQNGMKQTYPRKKKRKRSSLILTHHQYTNSDSNEEYKPDQGEMAALEIIANNSWSQDQSFQNNHNNRNNYNNHNNRNSMRSNDNYY